MVLTKQGSCSTSTPYTCSRQTEIQTDDTSHHTSPIHHHLVKVMGSEVIAAMTSLYTNHDDQTVIFTSKLNGKRMLDWALSCQAIPEHHWPPSTLFRDVIG